MKLTPCLFCLVGETTYPWNRHALLLFNTSFSLGIYKRSKMQLFSLKRIKWSIYIYQKDIRFLLSLDCRSQLDDENINVIRIGII